MPSPTSKIGGSPRLTPLDLLIRDLLLRLFRFRLVIFPLRLPRSSGCPAQASNRCLWQCGLPQGTGLFYIEGAATQHPAAAIGLPLLPGYHARKDFESRIAKVRRARIFDHCTTPHTQCQRNGAAGYSLKPTCTATVPNINRRYHTLLNPTPSITAFNSSGERKWVRELGR